MKANITFIRFNPFSTDNPPLAKEKTPPNKSRIMLKIDHPFVLFLL